jgi:hypothetical protein
MLSQRRFGHHRKALLKRTRAIGPLKPGGTPAIHQDHQILQDWTALPHRIAFSDQARRAVAKFNHLQLRFCPK